MTEPERSFEAGAALLADKLAYESERSKIVVGPGR